MSNKIGFLQWLNENEANSEVNSPESKQILNSLTTLSTILNGIDNKTFSAPKAEKLGADIFFYIHDIDNGVGIQKSLNELNGIQIMFSENNYNIQIRIWDDKSDKVGIEREAKFTSLKDTLDYINEIVDDINRWNNR